MESTSPASAGPSSDRGVLPGLAIASLVLGILGTLLSVVLVGAFLGLVGLVLGALHLARRKDARRLAWSGVGLSALGVLATAGFFALYTVSLRQITGGQPGGIVRTGGPEFSEWHGKPAPDFEVPLLDGSSLRLADLRGKRVVLDFWATWCPPCVREIPHFSRIHREVSTNDLVIVGISSEDRAVLKPFVQAKDVPYPVASSVNRSLPEPFSQVAAIPTTFFLDRRGRIQHVAVGYHDYATLLEHATAEDLPETAEGGVPVPAQ